MYIIKEKQTCLTYNQHAFIQFYYIASVEAVIMPMDNFRLANDVMTVFENDVFLLILKTILYY